jgi:hypothetical protein
MAAEDGVSVRSFCRRHGHPRSTFYHQLDRVAAFLNAERARAVVRLHPPPEASAVKDWTRDESHGAPIAIEKRAYHR